MASLSKIFGVATASIAKVNGVAVASIGNMGGATWPASGATKGYYIGGTSGTKTAAVDVLTVATDTAAGGVADNLPAATQYGDHAVGNATAVYAMGGQSSSILNSIEKYTTASDTRATLAATLSKVAVQGAGFGNATDGYQIAGATPGFTDAADKLVYATDTCSAVSSANSSSVEKDNAGMHAVDRGYLCCGNASTQKLDKCVYSTDTTSLVSSSAFTTGRHGPASLSGDGTAVYLAGGATASSPATTVDTAEKVTIATDTASTIASTISERRYVFSGFGAGSVGYVIGGLNSSSAASAVCDKLTVATETFAATTSANASVAGWVKAASAAGAS